MGRGYRLAGRKPAVWPSSLGTGCGGLPVPWSPDKGAPGPASPRLWWKPALGSRVKDFDATLGFPGEGPQLPRTTPSLKTETLTLVTANVTSWSTGTDAGVLSSDAEVLILQEVRLRDESFRAAKAESRRHSYHGQWAPAKRIGPCGPASGGLATLVCESTRQPLPPRGGYRLRFLARGGSSPRTGRSSLPSSWPPSRNRSGPPGSPGRYHTLWWKGSDPRRTALPPEPRWTLRAWGPSGPGTLGPGGPRTGS